MRAKEDLRRSVLERTRILRELFVRSPELLSESEVSNTDVACLADEQVGRLQILSKMPCTRWKM